METAQVSGWMAVYVLDPLNAPATVSSTVTCLVEVMGADDLEYAGVKDFQRAPWYPTTPQSGDWRPDVCALTTENIGSTEIKLTDAFARLHMGEKIVSFRQLLKTPYAVRLLPVTGHPNNTQLNIYPWQFSGYWDNSGTLITPKTNSDMFGNLAPLFTLMRGGLNITLQYGTYTVATTRLATVNQGDPVQPPIQSITSAISDFEQLYLPVTISNTSIEGGTIVSVPQYCQFYSMNTQDCLYINNTLNPDWTQYHSSLHMIQTFLETAGDVQVFRSVQDDFSFGGFASIPPFYKIF